MREECASELQASILVHSCQPQGVRLPHLVRVAKTSAFIRSVDMNSMPCIRPRNTFTSSLPIVPVKASNCRKQSLRRSSATAAKRFPGQSRKITSPEAISKTAPTT